MLVPVLWLVLGSCPPVLCVLSFFWLALARLRGKKKRRKERGGEMIAGLKINVKLDLSEGSRFRGGKVQRVEGLKGSGFRGFKILGLGLGFWFLRFGAQKGPGSRSGTKPCKTSFF